MKSKKLQNQLSKYKIITFFKKKIQIKFKPLPTMSTNIKKNKIKTSHKKDKVCLKTNRTIKGMTINQKITKKNFK